MAMTAIFNSRISK